MRLTILGSGAACAGSGGNSSGYVVEDAGVRDLFNRPQHPYTQTLMASVPQMEKTDRLYAIDGQPPALYDLPEGCRFADRCQHAQDVCRGEYPQTVQIQPGHTAACWRLDPSWREPALAGSGG